MEEKEGGGVETVETLTAKLENLNQGIAKYRDDAQKSSTEAKLAREEAKAAKEEAARVKAAIEEAKGGDDEEEPKLSPADQKKLDGWAKAQGFTTKAELEAQSQRLQVESIKAIENQAVEEFLKSHPDLNKDEEWKKIAEQFAIYKQPTTLTGYRQILAKVYKEVYGNEDADARARAAIENRRRLALGGGNTKADDAESVIDDYAERYPHLSREQIESRLAEINQLAEERAKKKASKKK